MSSAAYIIKQIEVGGHPFTVEIADTPKKRTAGLMGRQSMDPHGGMLFVLDNEPASFHMNNTYVPLDIAYFDSRGDMIQADKMEPLTGKSRCDVPASYALELPMGTCDRLEIKKGDRLSITESRGRLRESYEGQPYNRKKVYGVKSESLLRRVVSEILRSAGNI